MNILVYLQILVQILYNTPIAGFNFTLSNHIDQRGIVSLKDNRIILTDHQPNNNFVIGGQKYSDNVSKRYLDIPDNVAKLLFKDEEPGLKQYLDIIIKRKLIVDKYLDKQ